MHRKQEQDREQQQEQEQTRQGTESKSRAAERARAKAAVAPTDVDVATEGATPWRTWLATPPWMEPRHVGSGPSADSTVRSNQEENAAISVQTVEVVLLRVSMTREINRYAQLSICCLSS